MNLIGAFGVGFCNCTVTLLALSALGLQNAMNTPVDATVRITPLSLLWSSVLGTAAIASVALPILFWWTEAGSRSPIATGIGLTAGLGGALLFVFTVGYRRHGRPVPTTAWTENGALVIRIPDEWGTLIREELRLEMTPSLSSDDDPVVHGTAKEWWDPGRYEVRLQPDAAEALTQTQPGTE